MPVNYPTRTQLEEHFSIFLLNLPHCLNYEYFKYSQFGLLTAPLFENWIACLENSAWGIHEFFQNNLTNIQHRKFNPQSILSSYASESLFGKSRLNKNDAFDIFIKNQLNPNNPDYPRAETLLLSLQTTESNCLNVRLQTTEDKADIYDMGGLTFTFTTEWADLWIFPDTICTLAFKVVLKAVQENENTPLREPTIGDLNAFNRWFRHTLYEGLVVYSPNTSNEKQQWWQNIVYEKWLHKGDVLWPPKKSRWFKLSSNTIDLEKSWSELIQNNHYTKVLTAARIPDLPYDNITKAKQLANAWKKSEDPEFQSYASLYAALVTEMATFSDEGSALGFQAYETPQGRKWRYHANYLKKLFSTNKIEVWAYWNGIALQDSCAFLAWDASMPVVKHAESHYYILYVHICHLHFRLDDFAGKAIDYRLENTQQANQLLEEFHAFRNQYWFKDMTVGFVGAEICQRMKKGIGTDPLYTRVSDEVNQISTYLNVKQDKGWKFLVSIALICFYPLQMLWKKIAEFSWADIQSLWSNYPLVIIFGLLLILLIGIRLFQMRNQFISLRQRLSAWAYHQKFLNYRL